MGKQRGSDKSKKPIKQNYETIEHDVKEIEVKLHKVQVNL